MKTLVELRNVEVRYKNIGGELVAIRDVNLHVRQGEVLAIVGRSGCGKTTVLKVIAGIVRPTRGEVIVNVEGGLRNRIGVVFQSPLLLPWRRVLSNVLLPIEIMGEDLEKYKARALELLERVGLRGFEHSYPWELSGGMQQRVALCRALIHKPLLLLLDEPFAALDAITSEELWGLFQRILQYENYTTVLITHDVREAVYLADRVVVMAGRPGTVKAEVEIPFKRPRSTELQYTGEFNEYVFKIRSLLGD